LEINQQDEAYQSNPLPPLHASLAFTSPTPDASPNADALPAAASPLEKRTNWAACTLSNCFNSDPNGNGQVHIDTWGAWDGDRGQGLLDNLRGQCGGIYGWQFWYDNGDTTLGGHASFYASEGNICATNNGCPSGAGICSGHCVENAIWLASNPTGAAWGVECAVN
jgi:hypothetical protein